MISVIVPIYKVEKYLAKCIESILSQTYKDIEVILVDDGSPDNSAQICDEYAEKDHRIFVIHKSNGGVSSARNVGLEVARGEYITFVDPDDWIAPTMYEDMLAPLAIDEKLEMAICGYNYIKENGEVDREYKRSKNEMLDREELFDRLSDLPPTVRLGVVNKLFKTSLIGTLRFNERLHSSEDVLFLLEYIEKVKKAIFIHRPLYMNLIREGSATHGGLNAKKLAESFAVHEKMYMRTMAFYPKLRNHALAFLLDVCALKYKQIKLGGKDLARQSRKMIKKYARKALLNKEIYWKTRLYYLLLK